MMKSMRGLRGGAAMSLVLGLGLAGSPWPAVAQDAALAEEAVIPGEAPPEVMEDCTGPDADPALCGPAAGEPAAEPAEAAAEAEADAPEGEASPPSTEGGEAGGAAEAGDAEAAEEPAAAESAGEAPTLDAGEALGAAPADVPEQEPAGADEGAPDAEGAADALDNTAPGDVEATGDPAGEATPAAEDEAAAPDNAGNPAAATVDEPADAPVASEEESPPAAEEPQTGAPVMAEDAAPAAAGNGAGDAPAAIGEKVPAAAEDQPGADGEAPAAEDQPTADGEAPAEGQPVAGEAPTAVEDQPAPAGVAPAAVEDHLAADGDAPRTAEDQPAEAGATTTAAESSVPEEDLLDEEELEAAQRASVEEAVREALAAEEAKDEARREDERRDRMRILGAAAAGFAAGTLLPEIGARLVAQQGDRVILEQDDRLIVRSDETERLLALGGESSVDEADGFTRVTVERSDGSRVLSWRDETGALVRRVRVLPDGREIVLFDDSQTAPVRVTELPPIRREEQRTYFLSRSQPEDIRTALAATPVAQTGARYTLRQILANEQVRWLMPSLSLDAVTFETGSADLVVDQVRALGAMGRTLAEVIHEDPEEVFLVEGHTDAVGSDMTNLALSDRRAETVATLLTELYDVPPENLVTQGFGEADLKVPTMGPARENRRVDLRRLTPILQ